MEFSTFIDNLHNELKNPLPGEDVQWEMSALKHLRACKPEENTRESGVLILLYEKENITTSVIIKRAENNDVHSGEISMPGGGYEKKDGDIIQTALRETKEELGIDLSTIEVIGSLTPFYIPVSNYNVNPIVAFTYNIPEFTIEAKEVDYEIEYDILSLLRPELRKTMTKEIFGNKVEIPYFDIKGHVVWGATSMILNEFLTILKRIV